MKIISITNVKSITFTSSINNKVARLILSQMKTEHFTIIFLLAGWICFSKLLLNKNKAVLIDLKDKDEQILKLTNIVAADSLIFYDILRMTDNELTKDIIFKLNQDKFYHNERR